MVSPRLPSSKKSTSFPKEYLKQIEEVFGENFAEASKNGKIEATGRIFPKELVLRVGYLEKGRLAQANFEVSIDYNAKKENVAQLIYLAIDCAAAMMNEYLQEKEEADFPRSWKEFKVEKKSIYLQFSTVNTQLEEEANKILGVESTEQLVEGEDTQEELSQIKGMLGLEPDDEGSES